MRNLIHVLAGAAIGTLVASPPLFAQDGKTLFTDNCAPCHSLGGGRGVGPDLRNLGSRRNSDWLVRFITDPEGVTKSGDPYAVALAKQFDGEIMPTPQVTREQIDLILKYIDAESSSRGPAASGAPADAVFTPEDVARGRALFAGSTRLARGAPACLSCHSVGGEPGLGGGALGPNLAAAARRLNGAKGTAAVLAAPPTPVMHVVFRSAPLEPAEITALAAFLSDRAAGAPAPPVRGMFLLSGIFVAVTLFVSIGLAWHGRLRPVRRGIVSGGR